MKFPTVPPGPTASHAFCLTAFVALAVVLPAQAQEPVDRPFAVDSLPMVEAEGRGLVVLPSRGGPADALESVSGRFAAQSFEAGARRIHLVTFEGETFKAETPLDGPRSWIAFDPERRPLHRCCRASASNSNPGCKSTP